MDPTIAPILLLGFLVAIWLTFAELMSSTRPPVCAECTHCRQLADEKRRQEAELREWYAQRWGLGEHRDDDERHR